MAPQQYFKCQYIVFIEYLLVKKVIFEYDPNSNCLVSLCVSLHDFY